MRLVNLVKSLNDIMKCPKMWNYYANKKIQFNNINDTKECSNLIRQMLDNGGKHVGIVKDGLEWLESKYKKRIKHIVSAFFLGIMVYRKSPMIEDNINKAIEQVIRKGQKGNNEFLYFWFMLCFFHDLGYMFEEREEDRNCYDSYRNLESYKQEIEAQMGNRDNVSFIPENLFTPETCRSYYKYRDCKEHGLAIGGRLFEELKLNRQVHENSGRTDLDFSKRVDFLYYLISSVITVHNIWFYTGQEQRDEEEYKSHGLDNLILKMRNDGRPLQYPILFREYPILFFFCLIDTIEPVKQTDIFSDIKISTNRNTIRIQSNDEYYLEKIRSLNEWLCPVEYSKGKVIIRYIYPCE